MESERDFREPSGWEENCCTFQLCVTSSSSLGSR
ncbi:hypothetical protein KP509_24G078800 [Ceratopteris richardii]|uniref:Uncharacterized protein n=1 Tax=Ceratopteris richardii TaxID=49495 RepID=A0A8T2RYL1_CERRI|nr:hypothetical protein KP509_24G078800 [Ceratopteris richardii]